MNLFVKDLSEFVTLQDVTNTTSTQYANNEEHYIIWTRETTLNLLELYGAYRKKVGTTEIKNFKKLWIVLANLMKSKFGINVTPAQCENRWRVLERNYKKCIDNNNKTGRGRLNFEYENEMNLLLGHKKNINPQILLSTETVCAYPTEQKEQKSQSMQSNKEFVRPSTSDTVVSNEVNENNEVAHEIAANSEKRQKYETRKRRKVSYTKNDILEKLRCNKMKYQNEWLEIERKRLKIEEEKIFERKRKNDLIEERNKLIKECMDQNIPFPK